MAADLNGLVVIVAAALLGSQSTFSLEDAIFSTTASFTAMYRAIDDASIDAYAVGTLLDPSQKIGPEQACLGTDNRIAKRPSVLANPPLAAAAIAQRTNLVRTLSVYGAAIALLAGNAPNTEIAIALSDLNRSASELSISAESHAQGDLFIKDSAATLAAFAAHLPAARERSDTRQIVLDLNPTIEKLASVLGSDAALRQREAIRAARLDNQRWLAYYDAVRQASTSTTVQQKTPLPIPRCYEPVIPSNFASPIASDVENDGANFVGRATILTRVEASRNRYNALQAMDLIAVLRALSALTDAATKDLTTETNASADPAVQAALLRFRNAAQNLAEASRPINRPELDGRFDVLL